LGLFVDGAYQTFGVVSGGLSSLRLQCDFGTVFSTFGPEAFAFVQQGQSWVDPCGDVSAFGSCEGTVVHQCLSSLADGTREPTTRDCAETGRFCVETDLGALCGRVPGLTPGAPASEAGEDEDEDGAEGEAGASPEQLAERRKLVEARLRALEAGFYPPVATRVPWRE
jgi:hypothetical protein